MPNRTLKESIRESESIDKLSPEAERTFYRLITYADDYGLFKANARLINKAIFPLKDLKDSQVSKWLDEIAQTGMIAFYVGDDMKPYAIFKNWLEFNKPRNTKPKFPQPTENTTLYYDLQEFESKCLQMNEFAGICALSSSSSRSRNNTFACKGTHESDDLKTKKQSAENLYSEYLKLISPKNKSKPRAIHNLIEHHLKQHDPTSLSQSIKNYAKNIPNDPQYRKDPANFFGANDKYFITYLPENYVPDAQPQGYKPKPQRPVEDDFK